MSKITKFQNLLSMSPSSHQLSSSSASPPNITSNPNYLEESSFYESYRQPQEDTHLLGDDLRTKWHSTGHVPDTFRTSLLSATTNNHAPVAARNGVEYASVDIQNLNGNAGAGAPHIMASSLVNLHNFRSLKPAAGPGCLAPPPLPHAPPTAAAKTMTRPQQIYNLGNYFPKVASEPPSRKSYNNRERDMKVSPPHSSPFTSSNSRRLWSFDVKPKT